MIGLVTATHGNLGAELLVSVQMIIGPVCNAKAVGINQDNSMEDIRDAITAAVTEVGTDNNGVIIVTDMFGGTPSNLAISVLDEGEVEVVAGVNLPMLIKLASLRGERSLKKAVHEAQEAGRKYISVASQLLAEQAS